MLNKLKYLCIFFVVCAFSVVVAECKCKKAPEEWLFVVTADRFELEGDTLTLFKKSDDLIAFTDRPYRKQMHMTFQELAKSWGQGADSFKDDPPNAYLTWEDTSGDKPTMRAIELILLEVDIPTTQAKGYKFKVRKWQRTENQSLQGEAVSLFIDGFATRLGFRMMAQYAT